MKDIMLFNGIKIEAEIIQENDNDDNDEIEEEQPFNSHLMMIDQTHPSQIRSDNEQQE